MESTNENQCYQIAEIQLVYKSNVTLSLPPKVTSSKDAIDVFMESWENTKLELFEQFKVMFTNRGQNVLGILEYLTSEGYYILLLR